MDKEITIRFESGTVRRGLMFGAAASVIIVPAWLLAGQVGSLTSFTAGDPIVANDVNNNFATVVTAVNDNDTRLTATQADVADHENRLTATQADVADHENRLTDVEDRVLPGTARTWSALGNHATGQGLNYALSEYAVFLNASDSHAFWQPQLPHGSVVTEFRIYITKCNAQTGNTLTCSLRRHSRSSPGSFRTMAEFQVSGVPSPCAGSYVESSPSYTDISDAYTYTVKCEQSAAHSTSIYNVEIDYTR